MLIALDYDGTYTAAPELWDAFIAAAERFGHQVACVTMRFPSEPVEIACEVIYTGRLAKKPFMDGLGRKVGIWIDDNPAWVLYDAALA